MNAVIPPGQVEAPPASAWVRFLRSYGPTPNNLTLFDEHVSSALRRAKVQPVTLSSPMLEAIKARLKSGAPGSILIAGTAGDGKTYHCRSLWSALGGQREDWSTPVHVKELLLADGRKAVFVKDLSELNDSESDHVLTLLENSVLGNEENTFLVMAANHGQVLERLRDLGARQGRVHPLKKQLQDAFLLRGAAPPRLAVFDLSRTTHRETLEEVLKAVAGHPEWNKCDGCVLRSEGRVCPIYENRSRALSVADSGLFAERLGDLVEVARLNGWHLPVRDMLALVANIILGHPDAKEGLMACSDVHRIQEAGTVELARLYGNVFGTNLPRRRAMDRPVFKALDFFGIGTETSNSADGLLVYGADDSRLTDAFERLVKSDRIYGATPSFIAAQHRYLEGEEEARLGVGANNFLAFLEGQRRRLFFTLPANEGSYPYWAMSAFRFAGEYLEMLNALSEKRPVAESVRARLVRGLNRVMTGLLVENTDKIFVGSSGGFSQSRVSVLCDTEAPARRTAGIGMMLRIDQQTARPAIDVSLAPGTGNSVAFNLSPVRFEFLCRISDGALPGSFSNECLEDMLAFKAKMLRKAELIRQQQQANDEEAEAGFGADALTLNFIEVENTGHGFSKPITLRVGE